MWTKLLLLAIAVAAVWYGFKVFSRPSRRNAAPSPTVERTIKCPQCGVYVPMINAPSCGRDGCPYPPPARSGAP